MIEKSCFNESYITTIIMYAYDTQFEMEASLNAEFEGKNADFNLAQKQRQDINDETRKKLSDYYEKILIFSAGSFSFAITLVSLVVNNKTTALAEIGFWFPNVYWMYFSSIFFLLSCGLVLLSKRMEAYYIESFGLVNYLKKYVELENTKIKIYPILKEKIIFTGLSDAVKEVQTAKANLDKLLPAFDKNKVLQDRYFRFMVLFRNASEWLALSGAALLLFFSIQLIQAIVWG